MSGPGNADAAPASRGYVQDLTAVVRVPKTADLVALNLRRRIVRGELQAGDDLPTVAVLAEQFGISQPTMREAFRVLESEGLISVRRGSQGGARVMTPDSEGAARYAARVLQYRGATLAEVLDATAALEVACVSMLARTRTKAQLTRLREALAAEEEAGDPAQIVAAQTAFHSVLIGLSDLQTLIVLAEMLRSIVDVASRTAVELEGDSTRQNEAAHKGSMTHRRLVDLIEERDAAGAEELWDRHIQQTRNYLERTLGTQTLLELLG